jgi:hypothetical protein
MEHLSNPLKALLTQPSTNTSPGCWCGGTGKPRFTGEFCPCESGQKAEAVHDAESAARIKREREHVAQHRWAVSLNLPKRWEACEVSTSPVSQSMPALWSRLSWQPEPTVGAHRGDDEEYDKLMEESGWNAWIEWFRATYEASWYFHGGYGTGKTGLVAGMARELILGGALNDYEEPYYVRFVTVPDLLAEFRATYGDSAEKTEKDVMDFYFKPDVLIMDDLGAEQIKGTGWVEDRLYQVIGKRHAEKKPIWFTSNFNIKQTGERIGERIAWRIVEMCGSENIVEIKGPNLRAA